MLSGFYPACDVVRKLLVSLYGDFAIIPMVTFTETDHGGLFTGFNDQLNRKLPICDILDMKVYIFSGLVVEPDIQVPRQLRWMVIFLFVGVFYIKYRILLIALEFAIKSIGSVYTKVVLRIPEMI